MLTTNAIYTSKTHIFTSWFLTLIGGIVTFFVLFFAIWHFLAICVLFSGSVCVSRFCSIELITLLLPAIAFIFGLRGLWKAEKIKFVFWVLTIFGAITFFPMLCFIIYTLPVLIGYSNIAAVILVLLLILFFTCFLFGLRGIWKTRQVKKIENSAI